MRVFQSPSVRVLAIVILLLHLSVGGHAAQRPNIVFILVDDQDLLLDSYTHMTTLQSELVQKGITFTKHYGHVSQCCPARATLWTGRHAHNTNITSVIPNVPGGAWQQMQKNGLNNKLLPLWMKNAGYATYYSGKIFNGFGVKSYCDPVCVEGFTKADILVDPRTYLYYNSSYAHFNGQDWSINKRVPGYSTDQIAEYVSGYIDDAVNAHTPFFAVAAPVAPHIAGGAKYPNGNGSRYPYPMPKREYADLYQDLELPPNLNFNPANRSGVNAVWELERLGEGNIWYLNELYRHRQRALRSVDDLISTIVQKLNDTGVLNNTYIMYSSDNGYHIGGHRTQGGKCLSYEEDINIPFFVRGPGVAAGQTWDLVTGHIDMAPTILQLAGVAFDPAWELDGTPISFPLENQLDYIRNLEARGDSTHLEFWGPFKQEGMFNRINVNTSINLNIYKALRLQGKGYNLMYSVWCQSNAHELYDMTWDPHQMTNLHPSAPSENGTLNAFDRGMDTFLGRPTQQVLHRLDALVLVQKTCITDVCRAPWQQLNANIKTLTDALQEKYDDFFARSYSEAKVGWKQCYNGLREHNSSTLYDLANEQPVWLNATVRRLVLSSGAGDRAALSPWLLVMPWLMYLLLVGT